jgi:hypothetical protein
MKEDIRLICCGCLRGYSALKGKPSCLSCAGLVRRLVEPLHPAVFAELNVTDLQGLKLAPEKRVQ